MTHPLTPMPRAIPKAEVKCKHQPPYDTAGCPVCERIAPDPELHERGMKVYPGYRETFERMIAVRVDAYKWDKRACWATHALNVLFFWFAFKTSVRALVVISWRWQGASGYTPSLGFWVDAALAVGLYFEVVWLERQNAKRFTS